MNEVQRAKIILKTLNKIYPKTPIPLKLSFPFNKELPKFLQMIGNLIIRTIALNLALYFATSFATAYGTNSIAAYTIAINLWFFAAFAVDGYASAGNILSGKLFISNNMGSMNRIINKTTDDNCELIQVTTLDKLLIYDLQKNLFIWFKLIAFLK